MTLLTCLYLIGIGIIWHLLENVRGEGDFSHENSEILIKTKVSGKEREERVGINSVLRK